MKVPFRISTLSDGDGSVLGVYARLNTWEAVAITLHHVYPVLVVHRHSNGGPRMYGSVCDET